MSKILITVGALLIIVGLFWPFFVSSGLGRLPGDITIQKKNSVFYFPFMSSLLISAVLSLLLWFFSKRP